MYMLYAWVATSALCVEAQIVGCISWYQLHKTRQSSLASSLFTCPQYFADKIIAFDRLGKNVQLFNRLCSQQINSVLLK